jgi:hypothetical protein
MTYTRTIQVKQKDGHLVYYVPQWSCMDTWREFVTFADGHIFVSQFDTLQEAEVFLALNPLTKTVDNGLIINAVSDGKLVAIKTL